MTLTREQKNLLLAVRRRKTIKVRLLLAYGAQPNFAGVHKTTPLHEAVRNNDLTMVKALVTARARVNERTLDGKRPMDIAVEKGLGGIAHYLRSKGGRTSAEFSALPPPAPLQPGRFTEAALPEIFEAEKWVNKVKEMQELWQKVPSGLQEKFNFAAALAEARQQTLRQQSPGRTQFKKTEPPSPQGK